MSLRADFPFIYFQFAIAEHKLGVLFIQDLLVCEQILDDPQKKRYTKFSQTLQS